ncbi:MAG: hypothetical protein LBL74_05340 [Bacteroidales bacterium]|jgi:lysozyme|nr:hypothetical protein [Bacteroidales bacterium]
MVSKKRKKRIVIWSAVAVIVLLVGYVAFDYCIDYYRTYYACGGVKINYYDYPVRGIDVSAHQGKINWKQVADSDIRFAFVKATEGTDFIDGKMRTNLVEAKRNGIIVGAYHFFRFSKGGKEQAELFIKNVKPDMIDLPPVIDVEMSYGNFISSFNKDKVRSEIFIFLRAIEKEYGKTPIIYTNRKTWTDILSADFDDYPVWLCKLCSEPTIKWTFWQYSHQGSVSGIDKEVDMNTFCGNYNQFVDYVTGNSDKK